MDPEELRRRIRVRRRQRIVVRLPQRTPELLPAPELPSAALEPDPGILVKCTFGDGYEVWCDGYRASGAMLVFVSVFGVQTNVRALWARLAGSRREPFPLAADSFWCDSDVRYSSLRSMLAHQYMHLVMVHPEATATVSPFGDKFYVIGDDPRRQYWSRFVRMCQVPVKASWREGVWALGRAHNLIAELDGIGPVRGYRVQTGDAWAPVIVTAVQEGKLT